MFNRYYQEATSLMEYISGNSIPSEHNRSTGSNAFPDVTVPSAVGPHDVPNTRPCSEEADTPENSQGLMNSISTPSNDSGNNLQVYMPSHILFN